MSKLYPLVLVLGACGFSPAGLEPDAAQQVGSNQDGGGSSAVRCHASDPDLRLCLDFEDSPLGTTVVDLANHHDGSAANVVPVLREGQQAGGFVASQVAGVGSKISIAESPDLDIPDHVTFELYLGMTNPPEDDVWPVDNYGEYGLTFENDLLVCYAGGAYARATLPLAAGWHHVTCAYGDGKLRAYVDGLNVGCHTTFGSIHNNGDGMKLGDDFTGGIDDFHIYARTFGSVEIAQREGVTPTNDVVCKTN
jgi:hypothetical protein